jgi:hypothetical protein
LPEEKSSIVELCVGSIFDGRRVCRLLPLHSSFSVYTFEWCNISY